MAVAPVGALCFGSGSWDQHGEGGGDLASDVAVIGGGVFGLWCARACAARGLSVVLLDAGEVAGLDAARAASMGFVGALAPHRAAPWTEVKAVQLAALLSLPVEAAALARDTGLDPGWAPLGRIVPLRSAPARARAEDAAAASTARWAADTPPGAFAPFGARATLAPFGAPHSPAPFCAGPPLVPFGARPPLAPFGVRPAPRMAVIDAPADPGWLAPPSHGVQIDDLSARIAPRALLAALRAAVLAAGVTIREHAPVAAVDGGGVTLANGARLTADAVIVAAGAGSFALLAPFCGGAAPGWGVKGQAAFFDLPAPPGAPSINEGGLWIIPQSGGIAVGSTSERTWDGPGPDARLDAVLEQAAAICPALRGHAPAERWAGLRPRAIGRRPMAGPVPGAPGLWAATGGFKIGFALAHAVARALVAELCGAPASLPADFSPAAHLAERR
jgi:glycine/D-amino acid oxidase-like deaminating enzyme